MDTIESILKNGLEIKLNEFVVCVKNMTNSNITFSLFGQNAGEKLRT
jgi:hypothetical protein